MSINIYFNKIVDDEYLLQFKRMEDFVKKYLYNKFDFYKISLKYFEYDDKESAIKNSNRIYNYSDPYKFKIYIYTRYFLPFDEGIHDYNEFKIDDYKMYVVYHELGHLVYNLNHPEYAKMCNDYSQKAKKEGYISTMTLNEDEEKWANEVAEEFFIANDFESMKGM